MNLSQHRKYIFALAISFFIVIACLVVTYRLCDKFSVEFKDLNSSTYVSFFVSVAFIYFVSFYLWTRFSLLFGQARDTHDAFIDTGLLAIGKYMPGKFWGIIARGAILKDGVKISRKQVSVSIIEQAFTLGCGVLLVSILFTSTNFKLVKEYWLPALGISLLLIVFIAIAWRWTSRNFNLTNVANINWKIFWFTIGYMSMWLISAAPLIILMTAKSQMSVLEIINASSAFISAMISGWLAVFTPGGLGIREAVFSYISPNSLTWQQGLFWITLHRGLYALFDLAYGSLTLALIALRHKSADVTN